MPITTAMCSSFKEELFEGLHNFAAAGGDTFRLGLFIESSVDTYDADTTNYSDVTGGNDDEVSGTGYTAGGTALTNIDPTLDTGTAIVDFADAQFASADFSADGAFIYNDTNADRMVSVHDFGSTRTASGGNFDVIMPAAAAATAILRLA